MPHHEEENTYEPLYAEHGRISFDAEPEAPLTGVELFKENLRKHGESKGQLTVTDELRKIYETGDFEALDDRIDELVELALEKDEEFTSNAKFKANALRTNMLFPQDDLAISLRQKEIRDEYKRTVVSLAGLPEATGLSELEQSKLRVKEIIGETVESGDADEVLKALGILSIDEDGKEVYSYPKGLFPSETDKKWELYLDRVRQHLQIVKDVKNLKADPAEIGNAEVLRRSAHNSVTADVHEILGFDKLSVKNWSFVRTRGFLAKIRDERYPTASTAEKQRTTTEVLRAANVLEILGTKRPIEKQ